MNWDMFFQIIGLALSITALFLAILKYKNDREERLIEKQVKAKTAIKQMEEALSGAQFDQVDAKIEALDEMIVDLKSYFEASFAVVESKLDSNLKALFGTREELVKVSTEVKGFMKSTEKQVDQVAGKVTVLENEIRKVTFRKLNEKGD